MTNTSSSLPSPPTRFFIYLKSMKIITAILAIYIFGLNFMPCNDNVADLEEQSGIHLTSSEDGHQDHEHSSDLCSFAFLPMPLLPYSRDRRTAF